MNDNTKRIDLNDELISNTSNTRNHHDMIIKDR